MTQLRLPNSSFAVGVVANLKNFRDQEDLENATGRVMREWSWRFAMKLLLLALASTSAEEQQLHFGKTEPKWQSVNDALPEQPKPFEPQA